MMDLLVPKQLRGLNPYVLVALYGAAGFYLVPLLVQGKKKKSEAAKWGGGAGVVVGLSYARKQIACRLQDDGTGRCP